ncbi:MAG: glycosyltransferase, partial [Nitrospirota bacterium]
NIFILTNKLSNKQLLWARKAISRKNKAQLENGKIRIGYFPGSNSHDMDFETISDVLLKIIKENKNVALMIVGPLSINGKFSEVKTQIERHPFVSMKKLSELILCADINIVPLEIDNPFCQSKSGLKFFEAGVLKIPTVATSTDSFCQIIDNGENGFLAKNNDDWHNYLTILIKNKELRDKIGARAQLTSLEKHTTQENHPETEEFVHFIKEKLMSPACKVHRNLQY